MGYHGEKPFRLNAFCRYCSDESSRAMMCADCGNSCPEDSRKCFVEPEKCDCGLHDAFKEAI